jgi:hypothetical protein
VENHYQTTTQPKGTYKPSKWKYSTFKVPQAKIRTVTQNSFSQGLSRINLLPERMAAPPAVTAHILRNFSVAFVGIVGTIAAGTKVYDIASRKDRELTKGWGERRSYNAKPQPQQDRLYEPLSAQYRFLRQYLILIEEIQFSIGQSC